MDIYMINILLTSFFNLVRAKYHMSDGIPLITINYAQVDINIYTSASNPSREPKAWIFWHDPLIVSDSSKDIYQHNEQVHFQFLCTSAAFDRLARKAIITTMHPDVERFALFWIIEPLPVDTLIVYITDQTLLPVSAVYPCIKFKLSGALTIECQFQSSSKMMASSILQKIFCGKFNFQFEYYIQPTTHPLTIPFPSATSLHLQSLRLNLGVGKYIAQRQGKKFIEKYFRQLQSIDKTIKESDLEKFFQLAMNTTTRFELNHLNDIWSSEDIQSIINRDLYYITFHTNNQVLFHLKSTDSPWALTSAGKQTFHIDEIQMMLLNQDQINAEWSLKEKRWEIRSIITHLLSDVLDNLQLVLINRQYDLDKTHATAHRTINCNDWSITCTCQSTSSALVFISGTQFVRIPNIDMEFSSAGFTFELWIRPDVIRNRTRSVQILNFRSEYCLTYQTTGEVTFSIINQTRSHLYTTTLLAIPLHQWTYLSCIYSSEENQLELYVNGEFISNVKLSTKPHPLTNDIIIGQGFLGAVRELRLWACARNSNEIREIMQMNSLIGNETCLVGLWPMGNGIGQTILDLVLNNVSHPGTLGSDDNPHLLTDPIWVYVPLKHPSPSESRILTYQIYRENITVPVVVEWGSVLDIPVPADYDGDGFADFAVYRRTTMTWMISSSADRNVLLTKLWGISGDIPVRCNFDGDKFFDYTVFRPSTAQWISHLSSNPSFQYIHRWGEPSDIPCPGDFDGDGKTDFVVYRKGTFYINPSSDPSIQWTKQWGQPGDIPVSNCDFDADGQSDFTVWTPSSGIWSWIPSADPLLIYQRQWGSPYDTPFCADFDGDKREDFGIYRGWTGEWFIIPYNVSTFLITFQWGHSTDIPVAGDYDGDGKGDFALWRPRINRTYMWEIMPSSMPTTLIRKAWGIVGDDAADGDFVGDGRSDLAVFRRSTGFWYVLMIGSPGVQITKHWGFTINDTSVAADWDGDSINDFTVYRRSTGYWYIMLAKNPILQIFMQWGAPQFNDIAVPGDFDGDGKFDFTVWRPSTGMWFILPSSNPSHIVMSQWGLPDDIPVPGTDFDGDGKTDIAVWRPSSGSWYILPSSNPIYPFHSSFNIQQPLQQLPATTSTTQPITITPSPVVVPPVAGTTKALLLG